MALLDQLEARSKGSAPAGEAEAETPAAKIKFAKLAQRYRQARERSYQELAKFQAAVLKDGDTKADERYAQIQSAINQLDKELAALDDRLVVGLKAIDAAKTSEDATKARRSASDLVSRSTGSRSTATNCSRRWTPGTGYGTFRNMLTWVALAEIGSGNSPNR